MSFGNIRKPISDGFRSKILPNKESRHSKALCLTRRFDAVRRNFAKKDAGRGFRRLPFYFEVKSVAEDDIPALAEIERCESMLCGWSEAALRNEFYKENAVMLKAVDENGVVCGFITAEKVLDEVNVNNVAVNEKYRRGGVATALLKALEARTEGARYFLLEVRESNVAAVSLYKSLDYEIAGRRKNFYDTPPEDALFMVKGYYDSC
jgi:ribosomal-protein-alanine N-acetyltransferase